MLYETDSKRWTEIEEKKYTRATRLTALGRLLEGDGLLLAHSGDDGDKEVLALVEVALNLLANVALRELDVVLGGAVGGHEVKETVIDVDLQVRDQFGSLASFERGEHTSWYSLRKTLGTSMLWVEGEISSY